MSEYHLIAAEAEGVEPPRIAEETRVRALLVEHARKVSFTDRLDSAGL